MSRQYFSVHFSEEKESVFNVRILSLSDSLLFRSNLEKQEKNNATEMLEKCFIGHCDRS